MKVLVVKRFYLIFINQTFKSNNFSLNILTALNLFSFFPIFLVLHCIFIFLFKR
jgi:hypothetical protein